MKTRDLDRVAAVFLFTFLPGLAGGESYEPKTDNEIAALDLKTGKVLWTHKPPKLSDAHFELYDEGLIAYPNHFGDVYSKPIFLDPATGNAIENFQPDLKRILARSSVRWRQPEVVLENGWVLGKFPPEDDRTIRFLDPETREVVWTIENDWYPQSFGRWKDHFIYSLGNGNLKAVRTGGKKPAWTVELNALNVNALDLFAGIHLQVIDDTVYAQSRTHVFAFDPANGKLIWHRDLVRDLDLTETQIFSRARTGVSLFAKEGNLLVLASVGQVIVYDLEQKKYLWRLEPNTFIHSPSPMVRDGKLYIVSGAARRLVTLGDKKP